MRLRHAAMALMMVTATSLPARAEWQLKPFLALTFGGGTTIIDPEQASGTLNPGIGVSAVLVGDVFGVEVDIGHQPGFFQTGDKPLVLKSSVTTVTGNVTLSLPRRLTEYTLRPYAVGGFGLIRASRSATSFGLLSYERTLPAIDIGGGVVGYISNSLGVGWDVRYFRTVHGRNEGLSIGPEQLSFWRANMAVAIRY